MTPLASEAGSGRLGRRCITHVLRDIGSATSITHVLVGDVSRMYCAGGTPAILRTRPDYTML